MATENDAKYLTQYLNEREIFSASKYLEFPLVSNEKHTMKSSLNGYVKQRIPSIKLKELVSESNYMIEIHGIPSEILLKYVIDINLKEIELEYNKWPRNTICSRRPKYFQCKQKKLIIISIISGNDYIRHYCGLLRYFLYFECNINNMNILKVIVYPQMSTNLCLWTGFNSRIVHKNDNILIYGYSFLFLEYILNHFNSNILIKLTEFENYYYKSIRYKLNGLILNFYECKHHGWGNLSAIVMSEVCRLGIHEIIYISKGGCCDNMNNIYNKVYCPSNFTFCKYNKIQYQLININNLIPNGLLQFYACYDTGMHFSLPSVIEEDINVAHIIHSNYVKANSIDNEVSQIAYQIYKHNKKQ
eukprot:106860_1